MSPIGIAICVEAATSSHIEEMIKKLVQLEGLKVPATGTISEGTTTVLGNPHPRGAY